MPKIGISISLSEKLFKELEIQRGLVNRSRFVEFLLATSLEDPLLKDLSKELKEEKENAEK